MACRWWFAFLLCGAALIGSSAYGQLVNPSFENGLTGWSVVGGTIGTDIDVYTEGDPLPNAPDGTHYAGLRKFGGTVSDNVLIWQPYAVQSYTPGLPVHFRCEMWIACWTGNDPNDDGGSRIALTLGWENDGSVPSDPSSPTRVYDFFSASQKFTGNDNSLNPFRHIVTEGVLPDDPANIILRVRFLHNGHFSQSNQTLVDNVIFTAWSAAQPAPPATSVLTNGDFETEPYNVTYSSSTGGPVVMPTGWVWGGDGLWDDGPAEGMTNAGTEPPPLPHATDPLGVSTTDGTHFYGVAKPSTLGTQPKMTMYQIVPVTNASPCATGLRYKIHFLSNNSVDPLPDWWDHSGSEVRMRWMSSGEEPASINDVHPWMQINMSHVRYTNNEQTGMTIVEGGGEVDTAGPGGAPLGVQYVMFEIRLNTWRPPSDGYIYRALIDDVRLEVEAVGAETSRRIVTSTLPDAQCTYPYSQQLVGCGVGTLSWTLLSSLPAWVNLSPTGELTGTPDAEGLYTITVRLEDNQGVVEEKNLDINVIGPCGECLGQPIVFGITPYTAENNGVLNDALINGLLFQPGATSAVLRMAGQPDIPGTDVHVAGDGYSMTCDFDLTGAEPGYYDLYVSVPNCPPGIASAALTVTSTPCNNPAQDVDGDGDVDLSDFSVFLACFNGPNRPWPGPPVPQEDCVCLDDDADTDVDLADFGKFLSCFNGPARPPAPGCYLN